MPEILRKSAGSKSQPLVTIPPTNAASVSRVLDKTALSPVQVPKPLPDRLSLQRRTSENLLSTPVNKGVDSRSEHTAPLSNGFLMRSYDSSQHRDIELADKS